MENHFSELLNAYSSNLVSGNQTIAVSQYIFNMPITLFNEREYLSATFDRSVHLSSQILDLMQALPHVQKISLTGSRCEKIRRLDGDFKTRTYVEKCEERRRRKRKLEEEEDGEEETHGSRLGGESKVSFME